MPPSSVFFGFYCKWAWGCRPSSLLHWAVCIMFPSIAVLASRMTPPHRPEWGRMYLIYPKSSQWAEDVCVGECARDRFRDFWLNTWVWPMHAHTLYVHVHFLHVIRTSGRQMAFFSTKWFTELQRRTPQQQIKSPRSQLHPCRTRQLGHADKRCIDIGGDTRVAAVHIVSLSRGCRERRLCQTNSCLVMCFLPAGICRVKQCLSFSSR